VYSERIPLYAPTTVPWLPSHLQDIHWKDAAKEAEDALHDWLRLPSHIGVLLVDRATHALELAFDQLCTCDRHTIVLPERTFRAVHDAASSSDAVQAIEFNPICDCSWLSEGWAMREDCVYVPSTLGGTAIDLRWCRYNMAIVYDCAHTAYPDMFKDFPWAPYRLAVMSFFPTKPLGAFGGGALIGPKDNIERLRPLAWPITWSRPCRFYYPQTVQSAGLIARIDSWLEQRRAYQGGMWAKTATAVETLFGVQPCWCQGEGWSRWISRVPASPHLLTYAHTPALFKACVRANLQTGSHYPDLRGDGTDTARISIPWHTPEVAKRLREVAQQACVDACVSKCSARVGFFSPPAPKRQPSCPR